MNGIRFGAVLTPLLIFCSPLDQQLPEALTRIPAHALCGESQHRNFLEAYEANKDDIERLADMDWRTADPAEVRRLSRAQIPVQFAQRIDLALDLRGTVPSTPDGPFAQAYREHGGTIERISEMDWRTAEISTSETSAMRVTLQARDIERGVVFQHAYSVSPSGMYGEAYEVSRESLETLAAKDWRRDEVSGGESNALSALSRAAAIDIAAAIRDLPQGARQGPLAAAFEANADQIRAVAAKHWQDDELSRAEEAAVCEVLAAVSQ
ncbi:hypothetical protein ACFL0I_02625, partial [Gemmatimonadota bacterium]